MRAYIHLSMSYYPIQFEGVGKLCVLETGKLYIYVTVSATKVIPVTEITYIHLTGYGHVELHGANNGSKLPE